MTRDDEINERRRAFLKQTGNAAIVVAGAGAVGASYYSGKKTIAEEILQHPPEKVSDLTYDVMTSSAKDAGKGAKNKLDASAAIMAAVAAGYAASYMAQKETMPPEKKSGISRRDLFRKVPTAAGAVLLAGSGVSIINARGKDHAIDETVAVAPAIPTQDVPKVDAWRKGIKSDINQQEIAAGAVGLVGIAALGLSDAPKSLETILKAQKPSQSDGKGR